jgi:hypothetical protein
LGRAWRLDGLDRAGIHPLTAEDLYLSTWRYRPGPDCQGGEIDHETRLGPDVAPRPGHWADLVITAVRSDRLQPLVIKAPLQRQAVSSAGGAAAHHGIQRWSLNFCAVSFNVQPASRQIGATPPSPANPLRIASMLKAVRSPIHFCSKAVSTSWLSCRTA